MSHSAMFRSRLPQLSQNLITGTFLTGSASSNAVLQMIWTLGSSAAFLGHCPAVTLAMTW